MKDDAKLREDVLRALEWEPEIEPAGIGVTVKDGVVTLFGHVDSLARLWAVERAIRRVRGVAAVANEVEVRLRIDSERSDEDIARAAAMALEWNVWVPSGRVTVMVQKGAVILGGDVDWQYQREAALAAVRDLTGVKRVVDEIAVTPRAEPAAVAARVQEALARSADLVPSAVLVDATGRKVVLRGAVQTWAQRQEAERIAWAAPGVAAVENELIVRVPVSIPA